jgi:hypothetical protein
MHRPFCKESRGNYSLWRGSGGSSPGVSPASPAPIGQRTAVTHHLIFPFVRGQGGSSPLRGSGGSAPGVLP